MSADTPDTIVHDAAAGPQMTGAVHGRRAVTPDPRARSGARGIAPRVARARSPARSLRPLHERRRSLDAAMRAVDLARRRARVSAAACRSAAASASSISRRSRSATASSSAPQAYLQGRFDGSCVIGDHVWIGPQSYFDARDLVHRGLRRLGPGREGARLGAHRRCRSTCRSSRPISTSSRSGSATGRTSAPTP